MGRTKGGQQKVSEKRHFLTVDEAISILPDGDSIHTFRDAAVLIGADWSRKDIIDAIQKSELREITGPGARGSGHGLAVYPKNAIYHSDILFVETDKKRLDELDGGETA
jgi:hypothetical protein